MSYTKQKKKIQEQVVYSKSANGGEMCEKKIQSVFDFMLL